MQRLYKYFLILLIAATKLYGQEDEITLYDYEGRAVSYIAVDDDLTIYTWDGEPVAYLTPRGDDFHIYGFNGNHLGWFQNGVIRDHNGDAVGFVEGAINMLTELESLKSLKSLKPLKALRELAPLKPVNTLQWSRLPLSVFLRLGIDD